jgi:hypothetical protein
MGLEIETTRSPQDDNLNNPDEFIPPEDIIDDKVEMSYSSDDRSTVSTEQDVPRAISQQANASAGEPIASIEVDPFVVLEVEPTTAHAPVAPSTSTRAGFLTRLFRSSDVPEDAADDRILSLRRACEPELPDGESNDSFPDRAASPPGLPHLVFLSGPETGRVIHIPDQPAEAIEFRLLAADDVAPARLRLWREQDRVFLQHLEGAPINVSDAPLMMPLIVLDHGDEISTRTTRVLFEER